jgi:dienelactone hydrolase
MVRPAFLIALATAALLLLVLAALRGAVSPFRLPSPTGPFPVGTALRSAVVGGKNVALQLWYPALGVAGRRAVRYRFGDPSQRTFRSRILDGLVTTDSHLDAEMTPGPHAVLLYVPSWGGGRSDNTALAQSLASRGFVVVAMDDLYPLPVIDFSSETAYRDSLRWCNEKVRLQAGDARLVLDELEKWDAHDPAGLLENRLDLQRVGAFGFSFGGAVAAELARLDPRVRAGIDMDGWVFGEAAEIGVPRPFLVMSTGPDAATVDGPGVPLSQHYSAVFDRLNETQIVKGFERYGGALLTIEGTKHYNFNDVAFLPSIRHTGLGPIGGPRAARIVQTYLLEFFDRWLNGRPAPLFEVRESGAGPTAALRSLDAAARLDVWPATDHPRG